MMTMTMIHLLPGSPNVPPPLPMDFLDFDFDENINP